MKKEILSFIEQADERTTSLIYFFIQGLKKKA